MDKNNISPRDGEVKVLEYDFSDIDYELDRSRSIVTGLWSTVYFAKPIVHPPKPDVSTACSTSETFDGRFSDPPCSFYAVKMPKGASAKKVFGQEAKILSALQQSESSHEYIVPFYGIDERNSALIFEGVGHGPPEDPSLQGFVKNFTTMTEHERHKAFRELFVTAARDLIGGLEFVHTHGIIHADIKPANILLDIEQTDSNNSPVLQARYIDFSASFYSGSDSSQAGGTWDYMAPEQILAYKEPPTFASDVWSLGITLLFVLVGNSPYLATCGTDAFRVREAVKQGTPFVHARYDLAVLERMKACQDLLDCCKLALQKDRDSRLSAAAWMEWLEKK